VLALDQSRFSVIALFIWLSIFLIQVLWQVSGQKSRVFPALKQSVTKGAWGAHAGVVHPHYLDLTSMLEFAGTATQFGRELVELSHSHLLEL